MTVYSKDTLRARGQRRRRGREGKYLKKEREYLKLDLRYDLVIESLSNLPSFVKIDSLQHKE